MKLYFCFQCLNPSLCKQSGALSAAKAAWKIIFLWNTFFSLSTVFFFLYNIYVFKTQALGWKLSGFWHPPPSEAQSNKLCRNSVQLTVLHKWAQQKSHFVFLFLLLQNLSHSNRDIPMSSSQKTQSHQEEGVQRGGMYHTALTVHWLEPPFSQHEHL